MPSHPPRPPGGVLRHFTVAVFVVHAGQVLLHYHRKLGKWLPPGGHIEDDELPDEAALREVFEETGLRVQLVGQVGLPIEPGAASPAVYPRQLVIPAGIQLEDIYPGHQHIDLVYFAIPAPAAATPNQLDPRLAERDQVGWYAPGQLATLGASEEIQAWARRALDALSGTC